MYKLALLLAATHAFAQSVTVSPANGSVAVGRTLQFSAQVTGLSSTSVVWYAGGVKGGNATAGTISATGLYTAPAKLPAQNPVQIAAVSTVKPSVKGYVFVNILSLGPTITSVSPNPLTPGTITVIIQGSGFQSGASVFISYGSGAIQMSTLSVSSGEVKATGYLGPSSSAIFCVKNPGSICSNALTVPVSGGPQMYSLTVVNGSGSGSFTAGAVVTITANPPPSGQVFQNWTGATVANPAASTTTLTMPAANTTVTANYSSGTPSYTLTVVNGSGGGSYTSGTVVTITANTPPAGQQFGSWTGATVASPNASTTTLTMPAANTTVTANFFTPASVPYPVTTHPRLWITQGDLPRFQSWATASNPVYQQGIVPLLNQAVYVYNTYYLPGGVLNPGSPNPNYPDNGDTQGYGVGVTPPGGGYFVIPITEELAAVFAFNSLIDPNAANRITYAQYARNLIMYAMDQAALGVQSGAPFRDPLFPVYNRANGSGELWPLIVDWIYNTTDSSGNPILTPADKATIRNVFMIWANECLNAYTTGGDHPSPVGVINNLQLLPNSQPYRMAANNYYLGHARLLTLMALSIDPQDDPVVNAGAPAAQIGNTLRSYILDANGAWLYQEYAMFGEPAAVASAYGIPGSGAGFGLASGGLPPEGMLYGHSIGYMLTQLLALQTAGFNNASYSGPQIALIGSPVWDRFVKGMLEELTPAAQTPASEAWLGPVYQYGSYGDLLRLYVTPDFMAPFALLALLEGQNGSTAHLNAARWYSINAMQGGAPALLNRVSDPWSWSTELSFLYFMLLDPTAATATDPRPTLPLTFYDPGAGRIVAHSDWSPTGTYFDYRASWESINHQDGDGGQFELYRKGEWLTKELSNYDNNGNGQATMYHNTLALQNWSAQGTPNLQWWQNAEWTNGSQWILGTNAGDPTTSMSTGPGYVYAASNLTNLYNLPNIWTPSAAAMDITQATRSILWLNNDYIVIYDRATSIHSNLFKRFNLSLVTSPAINGNAAKETLASGQQLFVQTLLPQNPTLSVTNGAANLTSVAELEPTQYIFTVQDATNPVDTRFLHVLQAADAGAAMVPAAYVQSTSGTAFDGAIFGSTGVYFPVSATASFTGTALPAPSGVHTIMISGLTPGAGYSLSLQGNSVVVSAGGAAAADAAGLLTFSF